MDAEGIGMSNWTETEADHPMTIMLNEILQGHIEMCDEAGITPWDFCVVLANVQGIILGTSHDMPTRTALKGIDDLRKVATMRLHGERAPQGGSKAAH